MLDMLTDAVTGAADDVARAEAVREWPARSRARRPLGWHLQNLAAYLVCRLVERVLGGAG